MPASIDFHNLAGAAIEPALAALLEECLQRGERAIVKVASRERLDALNAGLWTYHPASFLPHGAAADGQPERQPIWLTTIDENPNGATLLVLVEGAESGDVDSFARCVYLFDREDPEGRELARERWRRYRDAGHAVVYWEHSAQGWRRQG